MYAPVEAQAMSIRRPDPPLEYLRSASVSSLESYELSRLNHAANLRREIAALLDQWIEETVHAQMARWVLEGRVLPQHAQPFVPQTQLPFEVAMAPEMAALRLARPLKPAAPQR
jgi:hypothetical protein